MNSISPDGIRWNDEARAKIIDDADRVLREAVLEVASTHRAGSWEDAFAELTARLTGRFIDLEPGPDLRRYAEAIADGRIEGAASGTSDASEPSSARTGGEPVAATRAESSSAETADAAYVEQPADDLAADAGASQPATPETDGSSQQASPRSDGSGDDPASGDRSDGDEAPNETIDDPSDPTVTDEPGS